VRILLLGAGGQVGRALQGPLSSLVGRRGHLRACGRDELDLEEPAALTAALEAERPRIIINAAAFTHVDRAEEQPERAQRINATAVGELGRWASDHEAAVIHLSTDYVFDGRSDEPYRPDDPTGPLNHYARTKLAGERALLASGAPALVFRVAWVYSLYRAGFLAVMMRLAAERETLKVVADQTGSPTSATDLATALSLIIGAVRHDPLGAMTTHRGVYHLGGRGGCTRWELVKAAVEAHPHRPQLAVKTIEKVGSDAFPAPAARPAYTVLDNASTEETFDINLPPWREGLARCLHERFGPR